MMNLLICQFLMDQLQNRHFFLFNPFNTVVDPSQHTDGFPYICQYCSKCFLSFFQSLKSINISSINISSKHTKSLYTRFYIPLSVLDTIVKLGMVQFQVFFFHTKSRFPWASLANPSCFYGFHSL